jgi:hypothetical protein
VPGIQMILQPTVSSENCRPAFRTACALARRCDAALLLLHVMLPSASPLMLRALPNRLRSAWASWQFSGVPILSGPFNWLDNLRSGNTVPPRRTLLQAGLIALFCTLVLGRASTAGSPAPRDMSSSPDVRDRARTPVRARSDQPVGVPRLDTRWNLRSGKRAHVFYATVRWDDINDDETSDDPTDDDDGWEGLNAFSETESPVLALLQEIGCRQSEPEIQSGPLWSTPPFVISFLTLQRLRC